MERTTTLALRAAGPQDARSLAALRAQSLIELGLLEPAGAPAFVDEAAAGFAGLFASGKLAAWLAFDGDRAAGCACVVFWERLPYPDGSTHAEIAGVYVAPPHRRRGLATELVRRALAGARGRATRKIVLQPTAAARALYERLGFGPGRQMQLRGR